MTSSTDNDSLDLLVVGAGPTGIAIGAEAKRAGLEALLVDRGPLVANQCHQKPQASEQSPPEAVLLHWSRNEGLHRQ